MNSYKVNIKYVYFALFFVVIFLSIGFSFFNASVFIKDILAVVRVEKDIRITSISVDSFTSDAISNYEDYNVSSIFSSVNLPNDDSTITYRVDITNFEGPEMAILDIVGINENLEYSISNYTLKDKICNSSNKCSLGIVKDIYITIGYKDGMYDSNNTVYNINLDFDFRAFHTVSYENITNNNYPSEVLDGDSLQVKFNPSVDTGFIITMDSVVLNSYSYTFYNKEILTIPNVSGDIVIKRISNFGETVILNNTISSGCPTLDGNYAIINAIETKSMFCSIPDIYGTSYYFRGSATSNYVYFAGYYWRIIRVNGDNTVRLIYVGNNALANGYNDSSTLYTRIGLGYFNSTMKNNSTLGYMYGSSTTSYSATHTNTNDSTIKTNIDSWYVSSGLSSYEDYLGDAYFCNDRSLYKEEYSTKFGIKKVSSTDNIGGLGTGNADTALGYGTNKTYYGAFYRLVKSDDGTEYPTLMCNKNDSFTVEDTINGNGALDYPIATITGDELVLAGAIYHDDTANKSFYLYTGYRYWAMTPSFLLSYSGAFNLYSTGWMTGAGTISSNMGYRPVINISTSAFVLSGDGKQNTPYRLSIQ